jgi:ribonuclease HII
MLEKVDWISYGFDLVAGVDEVGRGCVAGPVYAAAVIINEKFDIKGVTDSKLVSEKKRAELAGLIKSQALSWAVGVAEVAEITKFNILQATFLAMKRAVQSLGIVPELVLVDGHQKIPQFNFKQECLIKGDLRCLPISCASIIAKVARDEKMLELDEQYPGYLLREHKGYGTPTHLKIIREKGPSPIHRATFKGVKEYITENQINAKSINL